MSVNKKAAPAGLHGGSLHCSQTRWRGGGGPGWWLVVKRLCIREMGRGVGKKKEREGHRYIAIGRMSNEDKKTGGGC